MTALFVLLGITIISLLVILLWYVPHLVQQQARRSAEEVEQLHTIPLDIRNGQEAGTQRQSCLSSAIISLQQQLANLTTFPQQQVPIDSDGQAIRQLEERITALQQQIQRRIEARRQQQRQQDTYDNESWANLLSLLAVIQDRIAAVSVERTSVSVAMQARPLLDERDRETPYLRRMSDDSATCQWRLRRLLHERDTRVAHRRTREVGASSTTKRV